MYLELHDSEEGNSLCARINDLDYAYQAEQWVQETQGDHKNIVKWILLDDQGQVCIWERPVGNFEMPEITQRAERFGGTWKKGPNETVLPLLNKTVTS